MDRKRLGLGLLSCFVAAAPARALGSLPECTAELEAPWNAIWSKSLGVDGVDPIQPSVQSTRPERLRWPPATDGLHQWLPLGPKKAKLCGGVREHRPYCPNTFLDVLVECDRNAFILPAPGYEYLRDEPIQTGIVTDENKMVCCETATECSEEKEKCIETEITPSHEIGRDPGLSHVFRSLLGPGTTRTIDPAGTKPWLWKEMCTYGPWVGDSGHGTRPEIHPVQMRWTRERTERALVLMLMQDASARFTERRNFVHRHRPASDWNPWAASPVHGLFRVAVRADPRMPATIRITREMGNHIHRSTSDGCVPRDGGCAVEWKVGEDVVLRAVKLMPARDIHVSVVPVCRRADGLSLGYLEILATVGHKDCDEEGYLVLRVEEMPWTSAKPALAYSADALFRAEPDAPSPSQPHVPSPSEPGPRLGGGITRVEPTHLSRVEGEEAETAWRALVERVRSPDLVSGLQRFDSPPVSIVRAGTWEISVEPHYEGGVDVELLDTTGAVINEAIVERESETVKKLNPNAVSFRLETTGAEQRVEDQAAPARSVRVYSAAPGVAAPAPSEHAIRIEPKNLSKWSPGVRIRIPEEPAGGVYLVEFRATLVEDETGTGVPIHYTFLSHGIRAEDYRELIGHLLAGTAQTSHLEVSELFTMAGEIGDPWEDNRSTSARASQLLVGAETYAADGIITSHELEGLLYIFDRFRGTYEPRR